MTFFEKSAYGSRIWLYKKKIIKPVPVGRCFPFVFKEVSRIELNWEIQDGWLLTAWDCSSQWKRREWEDATLSDKFSSLTDQKIPSGGAPRVASTTLVASAAVLPAPWRGSSSCRVNGTGSPTDRCLELREGRAAYYKLKKKARHRKIRR